METRCRSDIEGLFGWFTSGWSGVSIEERALMPENLLMESTWVMLIEDGLLVV